MEELQNLRCMLRPLRASLRTDGERKESSTREDEDRFSNLFVLTRWSLPKSAIHPLQLVNNGCTHEHSYYSDSHTPTCLENIY